jgi:methyl-accepting chemotaxis protein
VQEISASSSEQSNGASQISLAIEQLSQITQQNSAAAEEMSSTAEELSNQAESMKEIISFFNTGQKTYTTSVRKAHNYKFSSGGTKHASATKASYIEKQDVKDDEFSMM